MTHGWKIKTENKKPNIVYTLETPFIEYLEDLRRIEICPESRTYYEAANTQHPEYTIQQTLTEYPPLQAWSKSMLEVYGSQLSEGLRKIFMDKVDDPVMNFRLWRTMKDISPQERKILRDKFRGKLPNIERKLNGSN